MIKELQDPVFMKQKVTFLRSVAEDRAVDLPYFGDLQLSDEQATSIEYDDVDELIRGLREIERDGTLHRDDRYWMPRNVYAALLQASLDTYYRRNDSVIAAADTLFGERLVSDPLVSANLLTGPRNVLRLKLADLPFRSEIVLLVFLAKLIKARRGKPSFPDNSAITTPLAANARVVMFGDWASGIPGASTLARTIWKDFLQPEMGKRELHVIHLGDAYYAGLASDYEHRFRLQWPVPLTYHKDVSSWTIPGNHDMYSGGWGFFELLKDKRFAAQNGASYFLLENADWQLFGLDSSYDPRDPTGNTGELYGEQATWLAQQRAAKPNKKCALLTHHQPFCAYNEVPENLTRRLKPIQAAGQIHAWFWGHEHLCAVYDAHQGIRFPVLLGHGGFPQSPKPKVASPPPIAFEWHDTWSHKDANASVLFGFAVLDFAGATIGVKLIDLFGNEKYRFQIA